MGAKCLCDCRKEHEDAKETLRWVEKAGRKGVLIDGDLAEPGTAEYALCKLPTSTDQSSLKDCLFATQNRVNLTHLH